MKNKLSISTVVLWTLVVVSMAVLVLFYGFGYDTQETIGLAVYTAPENTGLLLMWLYALVVICAGVAIILAIANGITLMGAKTKASGRSGWTFFVFLFTIAVVAVSFFIAKGVPIRLGDGKLFENVALLKLSDICLFSIYALFVVALLCSVFSMTGIFKARK